MSVQGIVRGESRLGLAGLAMALVLGLSGAGYGADFDRKPGSFAIVAPTAKEALSDSPTAVSNTPATPVPGAGRVLPQGLPNSSTASVKPVVAGDNIPPPPGPLGMKTPHGYVDATRQKPDDYPMLPGIFGKPDNNVGMILGVVVPISPGEKSGDKK